MGLTLSQYAHAKDLPVKFLRKLGLEEIEWQGEPAVRIPYGDVGGAETCGRIRTSVKGDRFRWEKGAQPILYGEWRLTRKKTQFICLVEGESDCQTLWRGGFPALGLPGAKSWKENWGDLFENFQRIYIVVEPDQGGETVLNWLRKSKIRERARLVRLEGHKDPSDLYLADPKNFTKAWAAAMKAAIPWSEPEVEVQQPGLTQVARLLRFAEQVEPFHTPDGLTFASIPVSGHKENWSLKSRQFRNWLLRGFYMETGSAPQSTSVQEALGVIESKALFEGPESVLFVRLAENAGKSYLDLCNDKWEAVEIDSNGWRLVTEPPVKFRRVRGMSPLPHPTSGGSVDQLRRFINVANDADWLLLLSWELATLRARGPYPVLILHGEQGSAKSTTSRVLRALVDPSTASLRSEPRELRDLMIAASNGWVINLDNLSRMPQWLSDALCRLATGGGYSTRQLYTDDEETLFDVQRPVICNGIEELAVRGDLLDRALILYLPPIPEGNRQPESGFWSDFETERPAILGALLDVVSGALRRLPEVHPQNVPRMADFAIWATAAENSLGWVDGAFLTTYARNQAAANDLALEASPLPEALRSLIAENGFGGTASELLKELTTRVDESTRHQKGWPQNARGLSNALRRLAANLRKCGVEVTFSRSRDRRRRRIITIRETASASSGASKKPASGVVIGGSEKLQRR